MVNTALVPGVYLSLHPKTCEESVDQECEMVTRLTREAEQQRDLGRDKP